jgi:RHS repeat-associated protein
MKESEPSTVSASYSAPFQGPAVGPQGSTGMPIDYAGTNSQPAISLSKGGGALRGIGEKFQANPATGTTSLAIPIAVAPGRTGFGPLLSLSYDSGSGNGPFGLGWSLSLPNISRRTDKGLPQYNDHDDIFILSGTEDLVPVSSDNATQDATGTTSGVYTVQRYCPRIEGLFGRIEKWTSTTDSTDVHWRTITPENTTTVYGQDANSRIYDPYDPSRIFQWLICGSYDKRGNSIEYVYKEEDATGVSLSDAHERYRTSKERSANRYLKYIWYGNRAPGQKGTSSDDTTKWMFQVVFDYGEHDQDDPKPEDAGPWLYRKDPFSTYRSTFEVRTYRLCRRVLTFHRIPEALGDPVTLVRSTSFAYQESANVSLMTSVTQSGHVRPTANNPSQGSRYITRSVPPTDFTYTSVPTRDELSKLVPQEVDQKSLKNLPRGVDGETYQWIDLNGDGLPSILSESDGSWYFKANTSTRNFTSTPSKTEGTSPFATFEPVRLLADKPLSASIDSDKTIFMDVEGDGTMDLVQIAGDPGYYPRINGKMNRYENRQENSWGAFQNFDQWPNVNQKDPTIRIVDVTGDGIADLLQAQDSMFTWYPSHGKSGYGAARITYGDNDHGARATFSDPNKAFFMVDLSGDGLSDLVRLTNGSVCYWPNMGYGKFGREIVMSNSPTLDSDEMFDLRRIRFADIDGSGTADLLYLTPRGVKLYRNNAGNSWDDEQELTVVPNVVDQTTVDVVDLLGMGTACLVWSSPLPSDSTSPMQYLDLMQGSKPYLLSRVVNNLGAETQIYYAPSTYFSLKDAEAGSPWVTRLPFPVHCVERTVTLDYIARTRFASRFAYHHGCFDGFEREFRGFASVEQWDAEEYLDSLDTLNESSSTTFVNLDKSSLAPPVHTKMWYHPGIYIDEPEIRRELASEYYGAPQWGDPAFDSFMADLLPGSTLSSASVLLTGPEMREAYRSLKGMPLRTEVYADDAGSNDDPVTVARSKIPYSISESNYVIELVQRKGNNRHAVFFPHASEQLARQLDRNPSDPRIQHSFVLEVDKCGNVLRSCSVAYGRAKGQSPLKPEDAAKQEQMHVVYSETDYTNKVDLPDDLVLPASCEGRSYEVSGLSPSGPRFTLGDFTKNDFAPLKNLVEIPHEQTLTPGALQKRMLACARTVYRRDDMTALLPVGQIQPRCLPGVQYQLALTPGLMSLAFKRTKPDGTVVDLLPNPAAVLGGPEGAYVDLDNDGRWWIPSGRMYFHPDPHATPSQELAMALQDFFLAKRTTDIFGNSGSLTYDDQKLLVVQTLDPMQNLTSCINDYRVMMPRLLTDPNGNQAEVVYDALGLVVASAIMGKANEHLGDSISGVQPDLPQTMIDDFFSNPRGPVAKSLLGTATSRFVYDVNRFYREPDVTKKKPIVLASVTRESHVSGGVPESDLNVQVMLSYSDGNEREIQTKGQVGPGPLEDGGPSVDPRWVCSGWTIYNNKGLPVRQYEPFFDDTHEFKFGVTVGVSPIILYDAIGRPVATIRPDHGWSKKVITPWEQQYFDSNDTILMDPKTDPDVGAIFRLLPDDDFLPTWYGARASGGKGSAEQDAAAKASAHANTPSIDHVDSLGRLFLHISDNGPSGKYESRTILDIQSHQLQAIDSKGRIIGKYVYGMLGSSLYQSSMEGGERWSLSNAAGSPMFTWNSRGYRSHFTYDSLQRPLATMMLGDGMTAEIIMHRTVYGDTLTSPDPKTQNQRTRVVQVYDQAGVISSGVYDFKGNLTETIRQFASNYKTVLDWSSGSLPLEPQLYTSSQTVDALNRVVTTTGPDGTTVKNSYDASAALVTVTASLKGEEDGSGSPIWTSFVTDIEYDAKGQRQSVTYNNGTKCQYTYDPETFRLTKLQTSQSDSSYKLQDLRYAYDPAGNITSITDNAQQTIFFRGQKVDPSNSYTYDALYRLVEAAGREHLGQTSNTPNSPTPPRPFDRVHTRLDHPGNSNAMGTYMETYTYDSVGNIQSVAHTGSQPASSGWTRTYTYNEPSQLEPSSAIYSNRLTLTSVGGVTDPYSYAGDAGTHGLMASMPHLTAMQWNSLDQLQSTSRQKVKDSNTIAETTYYVYDASGQRVRKVTERGGTGTRLKEAIYVSNVDTRRKYSGDGTTVSLERETVHIIDGSKRVAEVETRTQGTDNSPQRLIRYQYSNHIGSACLELDDQARIVSYEEYYPYGSTSYQARSSTTQVPKRYRYTGAERDTENSFDYRGSRYYAAWLGRWVSADPGGLIDGPNLYWYAHCNPITLTDPSGFQATGQNVEILARGNYGKGMSQVQVKMGYMDLEVPVYYKGNATWNEDAHSWVVDQSQLISHDEALDMGDAYWGDASNSANASTKEAPPSSAPGPDRQGTGQDENEDLVKSFAYGVVKGAITGLVFGFAFGALIATGGTAALLFGAIGVGMMGVQAGEIIVGKDLSGNPLSDAQRVEMAGELVGGAITGGLGAKAGKAFKGLGARNLSTGGIPPSGGGGGAPPPPSAEAPTPSPSPPPEALPAASPTPPTSARGQPAWRNVAGTKVGDNPAVQRVWNSVAKPNAKGTPRQLYNNHLDRFMRAIRRPANADARSFLTDNGFELPPGRRSLPFHPRAGNNRFGRLSMDHLTRLEDGGNPVDPDNLGWMMQGDNVNINNIEQVYDANGAPSWEGPTVRPLSDIAAELANMPDE